MEMQITGKIILDTILRQVIKEKDVLKWKI